MTQFVSQTVKEAHAAHDGSLRSDEAKSEFMQGLGAGERQAIATPGNVGDDTLLIETLHAENRMLRDQMSYLLAQTAYNHEVMCRHQAFDLEIVGAGSFPQLITSIFQTLPTISGLDMVTLTLLDQDSDIHTVMRLLRIFLAKLHEFLFIYLVIQYQKLADAHY